MRESHQGGSGGFRNHAAITSGHKAIPFVWCFSNSSTCWDGHRERFMNTTKFDQAKQRVHRHGFYVRFENCDSQRRSRIERFVCPRCGRTLSVLPKNRLPYIALSTTIVESEFDVRASGTDPLSRSEKERGCLRRAFERFAARVTPLCALLGQMIRPTKPSVGECWRCLALHGLKTRYPLRHVGTIAGVPGLEGLPWGYCTNN
jgi:hypothetical protein